MPIELIKEVIESGTCPKCGALIISDEQMTSYFCETSKDHFNLEVTFHGGEKMSAKLNGQPVDQDKLEEINW